MVVQNRHVRNADGCRISSNVGSQKVDKFCLEIREDYASFHCRKVANDGLCQFCEGHVTGYINPDQLVWITPYTRKPFNA